MKHFLPITIWNNLWNVMILLLRVTDRILALSVRCAHKLDVSKRQKEMRQNITHYKWDVDNIYGITFNAAWYLRPEAWDTLHLTFIWQIFAVATSIFSIFLYEEREGWDEDRETDMSISLRLSFIYRILFDLESFVYSSSSLVGAKSDAGMKSASVLCLTWCLFAHDD